MKQSILGLALATLAATLARADDMGARILTGVRVSKPQLVANSLVKRRIDAARRDEAPQDGNRIGFWAVGEGADGAKIGVIAPDYSPTEYIGAVFYCIPRGGVRVSIESPEKLKAGGRAKVTIGADAASAEYSGAVEDKMTEDGSVVVFNTTYNDPLFEDLAHATAISVVVAGKSVALPTRNNRRAFKEFFEKCRR